MPNRSWQITGLNNMTTETITYGELAKRLDAIFLFNKAFELDENLLEGLENGTLEYCTNHETHENGIDEPCEFDFKDIYQWYLIGSSDADYLKRNTNELIFYSRVLDEYVWGVTHFGTSWDSVNLEFGKDEE